MTEPEFRKFRLSDLNPAVYNPRVISDDNLEGLKSCLAKYGCVEPIVVNVRDGRNVIIGGHQRQKALIKLHGKDCEATCVVVDLDTADERLLNIALNNPEIQGEFDFEKLAESIDKIRQELPDDSGIVDLQIDRLIDEISKESKVLVEKESRLSLAEQFVVPPFSILDARQGYWQERKRAWIGLGIKSELGGRDKLKTTGSLSGSVPQYYGYKRQAESKLGRELSNAEFEQDYLFEYIPAGTTLAWTESGGILSIFDPVLSEIAYRWFCPANGHILDPFAGGSVRGIVAAHLGYGYTGVELRGEQVEANKQQAEQITPDNRPEWVTGDSTELDGLIDGKFDFIFSCPPYGDLEVYSDDPKDLSNMSYDEFLAAYRKIVHLSVERLKDNRFACFVVGDIRDKFGFYRNFVSDTIEAFQSAGAKLYNEGVLITQIGSLPVRVKRQFQSGRKFGKAHQNVLVFYKGDPKAIKQEFGEVEVGDVEDFS